MSPHGLGEWPRGLGWSWATSSSSDTYLQNPANDGQNTRFQYLWKTVLTSCPFTLPFTLTDTPDHSVTTTCFKNEDKTCHLEKVLG